MEPTLNSIPTAITQLEKHTSWWRPPPSKDKLTAALAAVTDLIANPGEIKSLSPQEKLKTLNILRSLEKWSAPSWTKRLTRAKEPEQPQLKQCVAALKAELAPTEDASLDKVYTELNAGTKKEKKLEKLQQIFYQSITSQRVDKGERTDLQAFNQAIKDHDVRQVELFILGGICKRWNGPSLAEALWDAQVALDNEIDQFDQPDPGVVDKAWQVVEALVRAGAPLNRRVPGWKDSRPESLLQAATYGGRVTLVQELLKREAPWTAEHRLQDRDDKALGVILESRKVDEQRVHPLLKHQIGTFGSTPEQVANGVLLVILRQLFEERQTVTVALNDNEKPVDVDEVLYGKHTNKELMHALFMMEPNYLGERINDSTTFLGALPDAVKEVFKEAAV